MSGILLCSQSLNPLALQNQCGISIDQLSTLSCTAPTRVAPNTAYLIGDNDTASNKGILAPLSSAPVAKELTQLSLSYGGDNVMALERSVKT